VHGPILDLVAFAGALCVARRHVLLHICCTGAYRVRISIVSLMTYLKRG